MRRKRGRGEQAEHSQGTSELLFQMVLFKWNQSKRERERERERERGNENRIIDQISLPTSIYLNPTDSDSNGCQIFLSIHPEPILYVKKYTQTISNPD